MPHAPLAEAPHLSRLVQNCLSAVMTTSAGIACSARLAMLMPVDGLCTPMVICIEHMWRGHPRVVCPMELFGRFQQGKGLKAWLSRAFRVLSHALQGFHWTDHPENHFGCMFDIPQSHSQNLGSIWKGPDLVLALLKSRTIFLQNECGQKLGDGVS